MRAAGKNNEQIAKELEVGVSTIRRRTLQLQSMKRLQNMKKEENTISE